MSDNEMNRRTYARLQQEIAEMENRRARYQAQLDRLWSERRAAQAEERRMKRQIDPYGLGLYD
jgi:uncharacterized coiled-coil DUF342 family protein